MSEFRAELMKDEGFRARVYKDHLGFDTIGYGTRVNEMVLTKAMAEHFLDLELDEKERRLEQIPEYLTLSGTRQDVIRSMAYQMGVRGVKNFKNMWGAIRAGNFIHAGVEMRDSQWWKDPQTRGRAERMALRMEADNWLV